MNNIKEIKIGLYGSVDSGKTSLTEKLTGFLYKNSIEQKHKVTLYTSCNSKKYLNEDLIYEEGFTNENLKNQIVLTTLDNPGHFRVLCNSLSNLAFIDIPLLLIDQDSFNQKMHVKYLDMFQFFGFTKVIIVQTKIDSISRADILNLQKKITENLEKYSFDYQIVPFTIFSNLAKTNLLSVIFNSKFEKLIYPDKYFVIKSFDKNKPGQIMLKDNNATIKNNLFSGAIIGGINYFGKNLNSYDFSNFVLGPVYLDLTNQKKEKITYIKPKLITITKPYDCEETLGGTSTLEISTDPCLASLDGLAGTILFQEKDLKEIHFLTVKIKKEWGSIVKNDKILLNILNMKVIGEVTKIGKKNIIDLKLLKALPFECKDIKFIMFKQVKNSQKLEMAGLGYVL